MNINRYILVLYVVFCCIETSYSSALSVELTSRDSSRELTRRNATVMIDGQMFQLPSQGILEYGTFSEQDEGIETIDDLGPSINKKNLEKFSNKFLKFYNEKPNHLSLLSYDLIGLIYYLSLKNDLSDTKLLFKKQSSFKGKIGVFDIKDNKINHKLNFYQIQNGSFKEIF